MKLLRHTKNADTNYGSHLSSMATQNLSSSLYFGKFKHDMF